MFDEPVLVTLALAALGTLVAYEIFNSIAGHWLMEWLKPIAMGGIAYAILSIPWTHVRYAIAAAGLVPLLRAVIVWLYVHAEKPTPITWTRR